MLAGALIGAGLSAAFLVAPATPGQGVRPPREPAAPAAGRGQPGADVLYPLAPVDPTLQAGLDRLLRHMDLDALAAAGRIGVALVDLGRPGAPRSAMINGDRMFYAASLPKLAILLGAYEAFATGRLEQTPTLRRELARMIRLSDNASATAVLDRLGFRTVAAILQRPSYRLYAPALGGGLWVGKAYAEDRYWRRDPIASLSHGATPRQAARFFVLLDRGLLVSPEASRQMKGLLGDPGLHHKFVRGLEHRPGATIYRKSGTWRQFHADAALVLRADARYVAVGLVQSSGGERLLQELILGLEDLVRERVREVPAE